MRSNAGGLKKRPTRYGSRATTSLSLAIRLHKKGEHAAAEVAYGAALTEDPRSLDAVMNLATLEAMLGRARSARARFHEAAALAPRDARVARDIGIGMAAIGETSAARRWLEQALALDASFVGAHLHASRVCAELGDSEGALEHARRAVVIAPDDPSSHLELYRASFADDALEASIAAAERAIELAPTHALAHYFRAAAIALARDDSSALAHHAIPPALAAAARYALQKRHPLPRFFATRRETLEFACRNADRPGPVVELGVRFGVSTRVLAAEVDRVDAFDSFEGLPEAWQGKPRGAFSTAGEAPDLPPNVAVHRGWFTQTLPSYAQATSTPLRLLHIDSDLYSSALTGLAALAPRFEHGTVVVFDQYIGNESWHEDEYRAFQEAAAQHRLRYRYLAFSWVTGQAVIQIE